MKKNLKNSLASILTLTLLSTATQAHFNFNECVGSGTFEQEIHKHTNNEDAVLVGEIPEGIKGLEINLISDKDVDIRLYGENEDKIVHWPSGILNKKNQETKPYENVPVTYTGYYGVDGKKGHEFVKVEGTTPTTMTMKAFAYQAGYATVNYSWTGKVGCKAQSLGNGSFSQTLEKNVSSLVGTLPPGIENVQINLSSDKDLDIQLFAQDGTAIASWKPKGLIWGSTEQNIVYKDMNITWSGYNGVDGLKGHEYITISNTTTQMLVLKMYGYEAGVADVSYSWENDENTKVYNKPLKSLFYQPWLSDANLNKQSNIAWNYVFSEMKEAKMDTLILQWTKADNINFINRQVYDVENKQETNWLTEILTKANNYQIKVIIGLDSYKDFFLKTQKKEESNGKLNKLEKYFSGLKKNHISQIKEILAYTKNENLKFDGWYLPDEYDNVNIYGKSDRRQKIIKKYFDNLSKAIKKVSNLPISVSAFFNSKKDVTKLKPSSYAKMLNDIIDGKYILFLQTGLGTNRTDGVGVDNYFNAFNSNYKSKVIPVIEGFKISYKTDGTADSYSAMDTESFYNQIDKIKKISKKGGFAFFSFRYFFYYHHRLLEDYQNKYIKL